MLSADLLMVFLFFFFLPNISLKLLLHFGKITSEKRERLAKSRMVIRTELSFRIIDFFYLNGADFSHALNGCNPHRRTCQSFSTTIMYCDFKRPDEE